MENSQYQGPEKRNYFRIVYSLSKRPRLKTGKLDYEVADISQGGIRFVSRHKSKPAKRIQGNLTFLCGVSIDLKGTVVWEQDNQFGLLLEDPIPSDKMEKEQQYVILHNGVKP